MNLSKLEGPPGNEGGKHLRMQLPHGPPVPGSFRARRGPALRRLSKACLFAGLLFACGDAAAQATLKGAGSTFAYPVYSKWFGAYQKKDVSVNFEYGYVGSSEGIKRILERTVDFGASDAVLSDEQIKQAGSDILHIPTFAGAVVITYHLPGQPVIRLDAGTVADLFLGKITKWNDERLAKLNPDVSLPDIAITVVHRSDGSGTTSIFTEYLSKVSTEWKDTVGQGKTVKWPAGRGGKGNKEVAEIVKATPGAIAYAEHAIVHELGLPDASLKNRSGQFISVNIDSIRAALTTATIPDDLRFSLTDAPGADAYPIAGATWLLVYRKGPDLPKNRKMVQFLKWAMTDGDEIVRDKECAPLPQELKKRVLAKLKLIKTP